VKKMIVKRIIRGEKTFTPTCDICGEELEIAYDYADAVENVKEAGWQSRFVD
jgi:hypothetical protein